MIGFKLVRKDFTGQKGFKFKIGEEFEKETCPVIGEDGFHFCKKLSDCFKYFDFDTKDVRYLIVEAYGKIHNIGTFEYATNKIRIVRELNEKEAKHQMKREQI